MYSTPASNSDDSLNFILIIFVLVWVVCGAVFANYRRKHRKFELANTSVLLTYYTDETLLLPLYEGTFGDMHYSAIAASPATPDAGNTLIYQVVLPFKSKLHLLGIPKKSGAVQLNPTGENSIMEKVNLEGDYNDYFTLYSEKGMQVDDRYALDPKAMEFTVEFCQSHNWEIVDNMLYFVQATPNVTDDPTAMAEDIVTFVKQIQPALAAPLTDADLVAHEPYDQEYRSDLKCPICQTTLDNEGQYLSCPNGHGTLLKGGELAELEKGDVTLNSSYPPRPVKHETLTCPSCGHRMEQTNYNGGPTVVDVCSNCPYRWLDATESVSPK